MTHDLEGKIILITGATEGIGKAAALELAQRGAALTIVGRNANKTERVRAELAAASGNGRIETLVGDLSKLSDMLAVAAAFKAKHDRLDVLVNNAGAVFQKHALSADGYEMTFALNHLGYFVLTRELTDVLARTPGARVVSTSSGAHRSGRIDLETLAKRPSGKAGFSAYCDSKLCNILYTRELARRLAGTGVTANCFHPGFVHTGFAQNNGGTVAVLVNVVGALVARTPVKGAETLVWLATSAEAGKTSGEYFHDKKIGRTTATARDDGLARKLWAFTEEICAGHATSAGATGA